MDTGEKVSVGETGTRDWTAAQRAAIEHGGGDLIVSAAAGSGKTAVLAERCARLVCGDGHGSEKRCGVENLLVLTFTEAAAGEMRTRIARAIGERLKMPGGDERWLRRQAAMVDRASISTLHAFCGRILRQHFHQAGVDPAFEVMDQDEARLLQDEVLEGLMAKWHRLPPEIPGRVTAEGFEAFFEAYAQGREADCARLVLDVHRMLATTEDPGAFKRAARRVYAEDAEKAVELYSSQTLMGRLKLVRLATRRAYAEVQPLLAAGEKMVKGLHEAVLVIDDAIDLLQDKGTAAWPFIVTQLTYKWMPLHRVDSISDFAGLRDRTWDDIKAQFRETAKLFARDPARMVVELKSLSAPLETLLAMVDEFETAYRAAKEEENRLDFADLERLALNLLQAPGSPAAAELRERYWHLLVDEFQDINPLQAALLNAVRHPARFAGQGNLFVVGDVKQSIYGFRLADPELFLARELAALAADARSNAATHPRRHVALQENFRSQPRLLEVMNGIFERVLTPEVAGVDYAQGHALKPPAGDNPPESLPVEVHLVATDSDAGGPDADDDSKANSAAATDDPEADDNSPDADEAPSAVELEAQLVARRIAEWIGQRRPVRQKDGSLRSVEYRDIAILLRSAKSRGMIFARALSDRGIPVHADLQSGFFDTPEVRNAVALLQVLDNPRQDIPLATALLGPFGGLTHDDLSLIRLTYDRKEVSFAEAVDAYAAADGKFVPRDAPPFSPALTAQLRGFLEKLTRWREKLRGRALHEGLAEIFAESGIFTYLSALDAGQQRVANLQMLHQRALAFASFRKQGLHRFLRFIERLRRQEEADGGEAPILSEASNVVRIMTIHKSKGLEFPVVFVSGLGGMLRLTSDGPVLLQRDLGIGLSVVDMERNIHYPSAASLRIRDVQRRAFRAEELRLLYVAMTRAREGLILTGHLRKADEVENWRKAWSGHGGGEAVPEDVLLKGRRALDWLMPALVMAGEGNLKVAWPNGKDDSAQTHDAQVIVTLHGTARSAPLKALSKASPEADRIRAGLPLNDVPDPSAIAPLVHRVTATYPFADAARQPAVQTVSFLKTLVEDRQSTEETLYLADPDAPAVEIDAAADQPSREAQTEAARQRGLATHRVLELLDLAASDAPEKIDAQVAALLAQNQLTPAEADRADWPGIRWFLWHSTTGPRLVAAARQRAAGSSAVTLRRELPFAWIGTLDRPADPEDLPTIRGVIDVLLVDADRRRAEIVDYKTDSARLWESRVDDYRRQMKYYMAAASDILGFKVEKATLVFLAARVEVVVA